MIPWQRLASSPLPAVSSQPRGPGPAELVLWKRGEDELVIRVGSHELMSSRQHHSEDELGRLACAHLGRGHVARVLVGGLGMGFTLRAVLDAVGPKAHVEVAELVPAVVEWNRGLLGPLAGHPLQDPRVRLFEGDVWARVTPGANFDAILLDVDNGPAALTSADNSRLYDHRGLEKLREALRPSGVLAVWSASDDPRFSRRFKSAGFDVLRHHVRARPEAGATHVLSIGTKLAPSRPMRDEAAGPAARPAARRGPGGYGSGRDERGYGSGRDERGGGGAEGYGRPARSPRGVGPRGFDGRSADRGAVGPRGGGRFDERGAVGPRGGGPGAARGPSGPRASGAARGERGRPASGPGGGRPSGGRRGR